MFGPCITIYFSMSPGIVWKPYFDYNLGEDVHFVHHEDGTVEPLDRQWSISVSWIFFHAHIALNLASKNGRGVRSDK